MTLRSTAPAHESQTELLASAPPEAGSSRLPSTPARPGTPFPRIDAVALPGPLAQFRAGWGRWQWASLLVATPLLYAAYASFATASGLGPAVALGVMAVLGALIVGTYLPRRGQSAAPTGACGAMSLFLLGIAAMPLSNTAHAPYAWGFAITALALGLAQRVLTPVACVA